MAINKPKLTIGMATYDDYAGCYFTIQMLRAFHNVREIEIVVIDNHPNKVNFLKSQIEDWFQRNTAGVKYIPYTDVTGTSAPRNQVFANASSDWVMCVDSHVGFLSGSIALLMKYIQEHPHSMDLLSGPLVLDSLDIFHTHFADIWRDRMWGTWGNAWETPDGNRFQVIEGEEALARYLTLEMNHVDFNAKYEESLPRIEYYGHERVLQNMKYKPLGLAWNDEFEIPGMGLGVFCCRRDAWLGFNTNFRGFGGEELYIHEKFRKAGRRCLCLGGLKWFHKFGNQSDSPYVNDNLDRIRNYIIGHTELGRPVDKVVEHFTSQLPELSIPWQELIQEAKDIANGEFVLPPQPEPIEVDTLAPIQMVQQVVSGPPAPPRIIKTEELPPEKPGGECLALCDELGIAKKPGCSCGQTAMMMDVLGVEGCRTAIKTIVIKMKANLEEYSLLEKIKAGSSAAKKGLFSIEAIILEACNRAEKKGQVLSKT